MISSQARPALLGGKPSFHATQIWLLIQWLRPFQANLAFSGALPAASASAPATRPEAAGQFETPDGVLAIDLSPVARDILEYVSKPAAARTPRGYERRVLDGYVPNQTAYLPDKRKVHLHKS